MNTRMALCFLVSLFFSQPIFSQKKEVQIPTHEDGRPIICEKFELLEKKIPHLFQPATPPSNIPLPPELQVQTRTDEDSQVGDSGKAEFEVHAAVNPFDYSNIIVGAMSITGTGQNVVLKFSVYYTNDFGATWEKSPFTGEFPNELVAGGGDPMIVFDENGKAYFTWVMVTVNTSSFEGKWGLYWATSTNGGANWTINSNPIEQNNFTDFLAFSDLSNAVDKQWMESDNYSTSAYQGNVYISYVDIDLQNSSYQMKVKRRLAGNNDFESDAVIISTDNYTIAQFASIDIGVDGAVYATFFGAKTGNDYGIYVAKSTDGGATFGTEKKVSTIAFPELFSGAAQVAGIAEDRLYPCPHVATDKSNPNNIYATWTAWGVDGQVSNGLDIYIVKSSDGGETWGTPTVVNDDALDAVHQFYSSIATNENGLVFVSWYDQRETPGSDDTHYYLGYSQDGGATFEQFNVSSMASDFGQIAGSNLSIGPGEYNEIVPVGEYIIPFWGDGRTNDGNISVWSAFVNLVSLDIEKIKSLNTQFTFKGPLPNPVLDNAIFELDLKKSSHVEVLLFDVSGKLIQRIESSKKGIGTHTIELKTTGLLAGEYFVTLNTDFGFQTEKIIKL